MLHWRLAGERAGRNSRRGMGDEAQARGRHGRASRVPVVILARVRTDPEPISRPMSPSGKPSPARGHALAPKDGFAVKFPRMSTASGARLRTPWFHIDSLDPGPPGRMVGIVFQHPAVPAA